MGMFDSINASASGLTAERLRMDVISNNLANVNTTRTADGGSFKRKTVVFEPRTQDSMSFAQVLSGETSQPVGQGVRAVRIAEDETPGSTVYNPGHPDADANGYVQMPNVNVVAEMVDMITATRAYEANATALSAAKNMAMKALEIGK